MCTAVISVLDIFKNFTLILRFNGMRFYVGFYYSMSSTLRHAIMFSALYVLGEVDDISSFSLRTGRCHSPVLEFLNNLWGLGTK
jgi:hypothetical protein